jgi:hypothetical protein
MATRGRLVIEYPAAGKTYGPAFGEEPKYGVYEYGEYEPWSVLAGQEKRSARGQFDTLEEAQAAFPAAVWHGEGSGFRDIEVPHTPPAWFDPALAGERWSEDDAY